MHEGVVETILSTAQHLSYFFLLMRFEIFERLSRNFLQKQICDFQVHLHIVEVGVCGTRMSKYKGKDNKGQEDFAEPGDEDF